MREALFEKLWRSHVARAFGGALIHVDRHPVHERTSRSSAANPKFASYRGGHGCELRNRDTSA
jgi:hypothetical protein